MIPPRCAIVDPYSSGALLTPEIRRRGGEAVCVRSTDRVPAMYASYQGGDFIRTLQHDGSIDRTSAQLRQLQVGHVLAGCELGVELADRLSESLGLPSNGTRQSRARRDKYLMAEAVRAGGLRTAAHFLATCRETLRVGIERIDRWPVIVKPLASTASDGVCLCREVTEVERAFHRIVAKTTTLGTVNRGVLVQEFLAGTEYAVDTVSHAGRHRLAAIWQYGKQPAGDGFLRTETLELLASTDPRHERLLAYARAVLCVLGIQYGPAHCEVVSVDGQPVLVEVGARLNGGNNPEITHYCGGPSQVELTVDAWLAIDRFLADVDRPVRLPRHGMRVFLLPGRRGTFEAIPDFSEIKTLPSFRQMRFSAKRGDRARRIAGWVILVHADRRVIERDRRRIRQLEADGLYSIRETRPPAPASPKSDAAQ